MPAKARTRGSITLHKLREAIVTLRKDVKLNGITEMDGMHVGGHIRSATRREDRGDGRLAENQMGKRMATLAMRERENANQTLPAAAPKERGDVDRVRLALVFSRIATMAFRFKRPTLRPNALKLVSLSNSCINGRSKTISGH